MLRVIDRQEVARRLTYQVCIPLIKQAMAAFSGGETTQLLRSILPLSVDRLFGIMPGALGPHSFFGAKLISIFHGNFNRGIPSHQGVIVLFDPESGAPVCIVDAGEVTAIRTAAASAVATDALARTNARRLAVLGYGEQASAHVRAISLVRKLESVVVWGRSQTRAESFVSKVQAEMKMMQGGIDIPIRTAASARQAVADADIICTLTSASEPILQGAWVSPGTHLNLVGSSHAGPVEVDNELVFRSRYFVDSREGVLQQGAEFLRAQEAGLITGNHIAGEIGQVLSNQIPGRLSEQEITVYKSLGHIVQDLASAWALYSG